MSTLLLQSKEYEKIKEEERIRMEETYSVDAQKNRLSPEEDLSGYDEEFNTIIREGKKNKEFLSLVLGKTTV